MNYYSKLFTVVILVCLVIIGFTGCNKDKEANKGFTLNISIDGMADTEVYLFRTSADSFGIKDTLGSGFLKNGKAQIKGEIDVPCNVELIFVQVKKGKEFILENGVINIFAPYWAISDAYLTGATVTGGNWNDKVNNLYNLDKAYSSDRIRYFGLWLEYVKMYKARTEPGADKEELKVIGKKAGDAWFELIKSRRSFLKTVLDTTVDPRYKLLIQLVHRPYSWADTLEFVEDYKAKYGNDYNIGLAASIKQSVFRQLDKNRFPAIGNSYKNFLVNSINGNKESPSSYLKKGNYVLIEFWASWCAPCRAEIPNLKEAYKKYKPMGFEIFAVSMDKDIDKWKRASAKEELPYVDTNESSDTRGTLGMTYGLDLSGLPSNVLISPEGIIVAKNLRGKDLEEKLKQLLD